MNFEGKQQSLLTFRVGPVLCCAPSLPVRSIITPPKLTHTPGSDSSQPGIFKHGSHIVKVLDLRQKFGIDKDQHVHPGNLIITIFENEGFAFWVDQIIDVFDFPTEGWGDLPPAIPRGVFTRTLLLNKKIHLYSEFEKLATINDLGYLIHYIQQLTQQEHKKDVVEISKKTNVTIKTNTDIKEETTKEEEKKSSIVSNAPSSVAVIETKQVSTTHQPIKNATISSADTINSPRFENNTPVNKSIPKTSVTTKRPPISSPAMPISRSSATTSSILPPAIKYEANKPVAQKTEPRTLKNNDVKKNSRDINDDDGSSSFALFIFFLILLGSLGAGLYFLFYEEEPAIVEYKNTTTAIPSPPVEEFSPPANTEVEDVIESPNEKQQTEKIVKIEKDELVQENISPDTEIESTKPFEEYRADIIHQQNEITITLHQPVTEKKSKELEIQPRKEEKINDAETTVVTKPAIETLNAEIENKPIPKTRIVSEVIHIVVKGDTLWAIAKKYVHDPFLYPELARLSNIKNPHRIYPGNRVRIRFIKN